MDELEHIISSSPRPTPSSRLDLRIQHLLSSKPEPVRPNGLARGARLLFVPMAAAVIGFVAGRVSTETDHLATPRATPIASQLEQESQEMIHLSNRASEQEIRNLESLLVIAPQSEPLWGTSRLDFRVE